MKALAILAKMLSPNYQVMIREAMSAFQAWTILRAFFVKNNLYNRVQMQKELMAAGDDLMQHLLRFDELCARLAAVRQVMADEASLSSDYDGTVRIIESYKDITLLDAKEMLRRELVCSRREKFKRRRSRLCHARVTVVGSKAAVAIARGRKAPATVRMGTSRSSVFTARSTVTSATFVPGVVS
ncbi:TPA: hypothetical protein N0F65_007320 [Lagenidium giganteum]|uniref:Polyprotein n=1 Tax=Lagenidium giganteum TaxID=4803 RepID=A0AAV2Z201_9STRA|nr:TPA: hypothetical protein N0F65_007320 [Lagenidium giganteum]